MSLNPVTICLLIHENVPRGVRQISTIVAVRLRLKWKHRRSLRFSSGVSPFRAKGHHWCVFSKRVCCLALFGPEHCAHIRYFETKSRSVSGIDDFVFRYATSENAIFTMWLLNHLIVHWKVLLEWKQSLEKVFCWLFHTSHMAARQDHCVNKSLHLLTTTQSFLVIHCSAYND